MRARALVPAYASLAGVVTWPLVAHLPTKLAYEPTVRHMLGVLDAGATIVNG